MVSGSAVSSLPESAADWAVGGSFSGVMFSVMMEFAEFTRAHFAREEDAMSRASYPGFPAQQRAHQKLLKQVGEIVSNVETGADVDYIAVLSFFREWLVDHILVMDKKYCPHLVERGVS